jgi:hypothetical protein
MEISHVWDAGFHHVMVCSRLACVSKYYEPYISLIFHFFSGLGKPWITETADTESVYTGARLYQWVRGNDCTSGYGGTTVQLGTGERLYQYIRELDCTSGYGGTTVPVGTGARLYQWVRGTTIHNEYFSDFIYKTNTASWDLD